MLGMHWQLYQKKYEDKKHTRDDNGHMAGESIQQREYERLQMESIQDRESMNLR